MKQPNHFVARLLDLWRGFVCDWFHGGGNIGYDYDGIYWKCCKCKRVVR